MDTKSIFLLGFLIFRVDRAYRSERLTWLAEQDARRRIPHQKTSIFLSLQSTDPGMTSLCLNGWCEKMDYVSVAPYKYNSWHKHTEPWLISHFSKMIYHNQHFPRQFEWYMFAFDDNYFFVEKLTNELSKLDSRLPIYIILKDFEAEFFHKPVLIFSRYALKRFYKQNMEKCNENLLTVEEWLTSCISSPSTSISMDRNNKSRIFAMKRHFIPDEMSQSFGYHDDKEYIYSHSSSLLSFTAINRVDLKLLPIFAEKILKGSANTIKVHKETYKTVLRTTTSTAKTTTTSSILFTPVTHF